MKTKKFVGQLVVKTVITDVKYQQSYTVIETRNENIRT